MHSTAQAGSVVTAVVVDQVDGGLEIWGTMDGGLVPASIHSEISRDLVEKRDFLLPPCVEVN